VHMVKRVQVTAVDTATHTVTFQLPTTAPAPDSRNQPLTMAPATTGVSLVVDFGRIPALPAGLAGLPKELRVGARAILELKTI
jgi:hypothetical protein